MCWLPLGEKETPTILYIKREKSPKERKTGSIGITRVVANLTTLPQNGRAPVGTYPRIKYPKFRKAVP